MSRYLYKTDQRGFSLLELLVVLAIFGLVMTGIFGVYLSTQRTANTEEQVVDLKQNQRVGLESITRDLRWAGFLISSTDNPIATAGTNNLIINTISGSRKVAQIDTGFPSDSMAETIALKEPLDLGIGDFVRIVRPASAAQPLPKVLTVTGIATSPPTVTVTGFSSTQVFLEGDVVVEYIDDDTDNDGNPNTFTSPRTVNSPNTISYSLTGTALSRNDGAGNEIVASGVSGLTFSYLLDDGTESANPAVTFDMGNIRAVEVTLDGEATTPNGIKKRAMTSTIALRNR